MVSSIHGDPPDPAVLCLLLPLLLPRWLIYLSYPKKNCLLAGSCWGTHLSCLKEINVSIALSVPVMPYPSTALVMLIMAGQRPHKNCAAGRAGMGGERMWNEKIV